MEEPSGSGLKPRQLEAELGGTSGSKRRAAVEEVRNNVDRKEILTLQRT
jgi:hypothetical protein